MNSPLAKFTIRLTICAAALLLSNRWCLAQDPCPNDGQVTLSNEETLASQYQPYPSGTPPVLQRFRFVPPGAWPPNKKFPTVLMLPPDIFKLESADDGVPTEKQGELRPPGSRASSSFRLITALRLRALWGISCRQIKDTRPSKPTTSNVRF